MGTNPSENPKLEEDRLSSLPDSILSHILSFLPTHEAVQTLLIQRFGTLWTSLPNLDLNDEYFLWPSGEEVNTTFFKFVHNLLTLHQRPTLDKFRLDINTFVYEAIESEHWRLEIDSWLTFALRKQVKVLELGFGILEPGLELYKLPFSVFVSDSVVELNLFHIEMVLQTRVQMCSLRVLQLECVSISDEVVREIIRGCPSLKELEFSDCWDVTEVTSSTLEILKIDNEIKRINCPKLLKFIYSGCVYGLDIINLSSLIEFSFHQLHGIEQLEFSKITQFQSVLTKLLHAKTAYLSSGIVTVMFYCMLKHLPHVSVNWNRVELCIWSTDQHILGLCHLLNKSPCLEKLVLNITSWHFSLQAIESELGSCSLDKEHFCWNSLKTIVIRNISKGLYRVVVQLVEILLKSSPVLDELVICYKVNDQWSQLPRAMTPEQLAEFSDKLPTFFKASPTAKVLIV